MNICCLNVGSKAKVLFKLEAAHLTLTAPKAFPEPFSNVYYYSLFLYPLPILYNFNFINTIKLKRDLENEKRVSRELAKEIGKRE